MNADLNNRPGRPGLSDQDLRLCLIEAEQRTANTDLPMDIRIRSRQRCETMGAEGGRTEQRSAP